MKRHPTAREGEVPGPPLRSVGPYEVVALLGKGSNGTVVLARRSGVERLFAVKLLAHLDAEAIARLRREAEVASRLEHPGIVQVHDVGEHVGQAYLVMDHVPGPTLKERLARDGPLPSREAATLVADLAEALEVAHAAGVVHRDLKPANVILDGRDGRPRITDFGLARDLTRPSELTREGAVLGTPYYMSPEQVKGEPAVPRSDIYALGVILYELLTGQRPFQAKHVSDLGWKILQGAVTPPSKVRQGVDPRVEAVCLQALSTAREARPPSAAALAAALRATCASPQAPSSATTPALELPARGPSPAVVVAAVGALLSVGLSTWLLAEHHNAADLLREGEELARRAEAQEAAAARAAPVQAALAGARAEVARLGAEVEALTRALARGRAIDARILSDRARPDGHLALVLDATIARLEELPGTASLRARLLRNRGRHDEAFQVVRQARAAGDGDLDLPLLLVTIETARGRPAAAEAALRELRAAAPPDGPHGVFARTTSDPTLKVDETLDLLARALRARPDCWFLHHLRARVLRQAGQHAGRVDGLRGAVQAATDAVDADPTNPDAYGERYSAMLQLLLAEPDAAEYYGPRLMTDIVTTRELRPSAEMWVDAGIALAHLDLPLAAVAEIDVGLSMAAPGWPGAARAHLWRGHALALMGDEGEAVREWLEARLGDLPASSAPPHARWLARVSPEARARALADASEAFRTELQRAIEALPPR